jgi:hypothetical protein
MFAITGFFHRYFSAVAAKAKSTACGPR